jgi:Leucine-rich repeat (LRR) protein
VSSSLEYLDLRNNKIQPLQELNILQNLKALRELYLHGGKMQSNPCCLPLQAYHEFLASLSNFSSLQKIDGVNA